MPASVRWTGLEELQAYLRTLPAHLTQEASAIVYAHARMAQQDVQANYPVRTGNLRANVRLTLNAVSRFGSGAVVKSAAPHAWIFERGTKPRQTDKGASRGTMPEARPEQQAIPKFIRWRIRMYAQLAAMLERNGLKVSGSLGRAA